MCLGMALRMRRVVLGLMVVGLWIPLSSMALAVYILFGGMSRLDGTALRFQKVLLGLRDFGRISVYEFVG